MIQLTGLIEMQGKIGALADALKPRIQSALYREGERIMARSKEEFVPVATGTLKASGHVRAGLQNTGEFGVELVYGGAASAYAIVQHETEWFEHPVGQWKYLETPMKEAVSGMSGRLAADMGL